MEGALGAAGRRLMLAALEGCGYEHAVPIGSLWRSVCSRVETMLPRRRVRRLTCAPSGEAPARMWAARLTDYTVDGLGLAT